MKDEPRKPLDPAKHLEQLRRKSVNQEPLSREEEVPEAEVLKADDRCFSLVSHRKRRLMLVLRYWNGNCKARSYSFLAGIDFDPSHGITLDFTGSVARIQGRNLRTLFDALATHRVGWIQEYDELQAEVKFEKDATVVTKISVETLPGG